MSDADLVSSVSLPLTPAQIRARLERDLAASVASTPPTILAPNQGGMIVGGFPLPGHVMPTNQSAAKMAAYIFAR